MDFVITRSKWLNASTNYHHELRPDAPRSCLLDPKTGLMCCLGQIELQKGQDRKNLQGVGEPAELADEYKVEPKTLGILVTKHSFVNYDEYDNGSKHYYQNTQLASDAMSINDDWELTELEREQELTKLFAKYGHTITFID